MRLRARDKQKVGKKRNAELLNSFSSPNIITMMKSGRVRWVKHVERMGKSSNSYRILAANRYTRTGHKREVNIKTQLKEIDIAKITGFIWVI